MNTISIIISHLRESLEKSGHDLHTKISELSDQEFTKWVFSSTRGTGDNLRGLRLHSLGYELMKSCYQCYEIDMPEDTKLTASQLLYLDRTATLPYYIDRTNSKLMLFEASLGVKLKLVDGSISALMEID